MDNDGLPDLFGVTGGTYPGIERRLPLYRYKTPRFIFRNLGNGKFEELIDEAGPDIGAPHCSRGCAFGDFDNDGDLDIVIMNFNEPPTLLRNDLRRDEKNPGYWLKVKLIGTQSNRSAIGTRVTARYGDRLQAQEVLAQSSFYSVDDRRLHFGLGAEPVSHLTVRWTNGAVEEFSKIAADQLVIIKEGEGILRKESWRANAKPA